MTDLGLMICVPLFFIFLRNPCADTWVVPIVRQRADKNSSRLVFIRICWFFIVVIDVILPTNVQNIFLNIRNGFVFFMTIVDG